LEEKDQNDGSTKHTRQRSAASTGSNRALSLHVFSNLANESKEKAAPLYQCSPNPAFEDAGQLLTHAVQALLDSPDARFETLYLWVRTFGHWRTIVEAPMAQSLGEFFHGRSKLDL
jgi:hypothetical protein